MIKLHLSQIDALETAIAKIEARIGDALGPFRAAVSLLTTMPGLSETTARVLIAEIGTDMSRFPGQAALTSVGLSQGVLPRVRVDRRLPALSSSRGQNAAHEIRCPTDRRL